MVRIEAADYLGNYEDEEVLEELKEKSQNDTHYLVRGFAIVSYSFVLDRLEKDPKEAIEFIKSCILREKRIFVKLDCYYALYVLGEKNNLEILLKYLNDRNQKNRIGVVNILSWILEEDENSKIIAALKERQRKEKVFGVLSTIEQALQIVKK